MVSFIYRRNNAATDYMKVVQHMAPKANAKNSNFTAVIRDEDLTEKLTDYQWDNRLTRPELVRLAIDEFAVKHKIVAPDYFTNQEAEAEKAEAPAEAPAAK